MNEGAAPMPGTADTNTKSLRPNHVRSLALAGAVVGVVLLPIAAAQANPSQSSASSQSSSARTAATAVGAAVQPLVAQPVAAQYCGTAVTESGGGGEITAQACVQQEDGTAIGRVFVTDESSYNQDVVLNLTRTDGTVIQIQCAVSVGQSDVQCATDPVAVSAGQGTYNAIAELAGVGRPLSAGVVHVESGQVAPAGS
jgi:hypothetical protein